MRKQYQLEQMMKLILFVLFCTIFSVKPEIITQQKLIKAGDSFTIECNVPQANWTFGGKSIATCTRCPSSCSVNPSYKNRITAYCNETTSVLHFNETNVNDTGTVKCKGEAKAFSLLVGDIGDKFHYENWPFALNNQDYTLVCERNFNQDITLYNEKGEQLAIFAGDDCENLASESKGFHITCEDKKVTLLIKKVTLNDDGKLFGCETGNQLLLFNLTVNVPVTSVSLHSPDQNFIENKEATFICTVEKSKPKAKFQWIIVYKNGSKEILKNNKLPDYPKPKSNGIYLKTNFSQKLELKKDYKKIMCNATIESLQWKKSEKELNIKYAPPGKPVLVNSSEKCAGKEIDVTCNWIGGEPKATLELLCLSEKKTGTSSVTTRKLLTREMKKECICNGFHIARNETTQKNLDIHYPPNKITIKQTLYHEGDNASLICNAFGGNPNNYNYIWSPGNQVGKEISIYLTKNLNQKQFTCNVHHSCDGNNHQHSTKEIIVEYKPIINTKDKITVIEYEINKLYCSAEGNPQPTTYWKIQNNIINSSLLQISFTRNNASKVQCIATANGKSGNMNTSKNIIFNVTYPPEIKIVYDVTKLHHQGYISCQATANPNKITYKIVQKWGKKRKSISTEHKSFKDVSYEDLGEWICLASNGVPKKEHFVQKSVEIKVPVQAHFKGGSNETAIVGSKKKIKICFYCYPNAKQVKWYKEKEEISSDQISYIPAEDGLFPFTGNCSILELKITEKNIQSYYLHITNEVNTTTFQVIIDSGIPNKLTTYIIISCVIVVLVFIIIGASVYWYKFRRSSRKEQSNKLVDNNNPTDDSEMINNSIYESGIPNNAVNVEDLYAKVDKSKTRQPQEKNVNVEDLYAKVDKSKTRQPQEKNASAVEPLYAQVNKRPPKSSKVNNVNVEDLYAKVDKSKTRQPQEKNVNVEDLYAKVDKSKTRQPQKKNAIENNSLYANVGVKPQSNKAKKKPVKKPAALPKPQPGATPNEDIYENLEMAQKKPVDIEEMVYADLEFLTDKDQNKPPPMKKEEETFYADIDFTK